MRIVLSINDLGRRIGESHHNAKITNGEVDLLLALHREGWGYRRLAAKFEMSKRHVRDIVKGKRRAQFPAAFKTIEMQD